MGKKIYLNMLCKRLIPNSNLKAILGYLNRFEQPAKAPVDQKVKSAIHRINHYPLDSANSFPNPYLLDSDLSGG